MLQYPVAHVVCATALYRALGVSTACSHDRRLLPETQHTPGTGTHHGSRTCTRGFPPAETQSWKVRRSGTYCLLQRAGQESSAPARQGSPATPAPTPTLGPRAPPGLRTGPSPSDPRPGAPRPFSAALSFFRGPGPRGHSKRPPLEYDPHASLCWGLDLWAAGHCFPLLLELTSLLSC